MKNVIIFIFVFLCSTTPLFAADYSFTDLNNDTFKVTATNKNGTIRITNPGKTFIDQLYVWADKGAQANTYVSKIFAQTDYNKLNPITSTPTNYALPTLEANHTFYLQIKTSKGEEVFQFKTDDINSTTTSFYPLNPSFTSATRTITVTMTGVPTTTNTYRLYNYSSPIGDAKAAVNGTVTWELTGADVVDNTQYLFHVKPVATTTFGGLPTDITQNKPFAVGTPPPASGSLFSFSVTPDSSTSAVVSGKAPSQSSDVSIKFEWAETGDEHTGPTNAYYRVAGPQGQTPIAQDGSYTIQVSNLSPSAKYFFKISLLSAGIATPLETKTGIFNTKDGYLVPGSVGEELDFNSRSYHLLAPWPGLSVLMDPDLCLEKKTSGDVPQDAICDVNGFLNFAFKLLIGLTAVVLVLRLMFEGYQYVVTDVPFLKASAKGNFFTALLGLLLALSAYIILNTINPKLVNNTITIDSVNLGVESTFTSGGGAYTGGTATPNANTNITTYDTFLRASSAQFGVEYALAKAHMYAESGGKPNATSDIKNRQGTIVNHAYGLMQLTRPTFEGLGYDFSMIYDPKTNIEAGIKFMGKLKTTACNSQSSNNVCDTSNVSYRIAAYNGGAGANKPSKSCPGKTLWQCDTVSDGYAETRNYVSKVLANQQKIIQKNW